MHFVRVRTAGSSGPPAGASGTGTGRRRRQADMRPLLERQYWAHGHAVQHLF